tara:strand:+ start:114 stop:248 length:135 start_codon:yes stop_codon:yes gene_type:complete
MNPYTKKITPNSHRFTDEKWGDNSVEDMSVCSTTIIELVESLPC